jgi:hypothetical protein
MTLKREQAPIRLANMAQIQNPREADGIENMEVRRQEENFKFETREKVAFSVLLIMSFYAALESTAIGVALPVSLHPAAACPNTSRASTNVENRTEHSTRHPWVLNPNILGGHLIPSRQLRLPTPVRFLLSHLWPITSCDLDTLSLYCGLNRMRVGS